MIKRPVFGGTIGAATISETEKGFGLNPINLSFSPYQPNI
jgi:hypothetical protein